jgi:hypothetical protein
LHYFIELFSSSSGPSLVPEWGFLQDIPELIFYCPIIMEYLQRVTLGVREIVLGVHDYIKLVAKEE